MGTRTLMGTGLTAALAATLALAAWARSGLGPQAAPSAAAAGRIYDQWAFEEFDGTGTSCVDGWQWHDAWGSSERICSSGRVRIIQSAFPARGQGMLWRNAESGGLLPPATQGRNVAIEVRLRYPLWRGYGTDGVVVFQDPYEGERTCFDSTRKHHHDDAHCPDPSPTIVGHSHAAGGVDWRSAKLDGDWNHPAGNGWSVWDRGVDWIIARWEHRAQDDHWDLYVYRTDDQPDDPMQPYRDQLPEGHWTRTAPAPEAVRIGHHIWFTGHGVGDGAGEWTDPEVDYIRVWTWDLATPTPTATNTLVPTDTHTPAPTDTATAVPTDTPMPTPTGTPTPQPLVLSGRVYVDLAGEGSPPGVGGVDIHLEARYRKWAQVDARLSAVMPTPSPTASPTDTPQPPAPTPTPTEPFWPTPTRTPVLKPTIPWSTRSVASSSVSSPFRVSCPPMLPLIMRNTEPPSRVPAAASSPLPHTPLPTVTPSTPTPEYRWLYRVVRGDPDHLTPTQVFSATYWSETPPFGLSMDTDVLLPGSYRYKLLASRWSYADHQEGEIDVCYSDEAVVHVSGGESRRIDLVAQHEEPLDVCLVADASLEVTPQAVDDPVFKEDILFAQTGVAGGYEFLVPWSVWPSAQAPDSRGWDGVFIREVPPVSMTPVRAGPGSGPAEVISTTLIRYPWTVRDDGTTYAQNDFALQPPATATPTPTATPTNTPTPTDTPTPGPSITPSPTPSSGVALPGGEVFVHVYEQSASTDPHTDYWCDELIGLEMQRWASLAPIFAPDSPPRLCHAGACDVGTVRTTHFTVTEIVNVTGGQPAFDAPGGSVVTYDGLHLWGDATYDPCEGLWFLALSQGGLAPVAPPCPRVVAEEGYPGTYRFEGTLAVSASWSSPVPYQHAWTLPITFWVALRSPQPHASGSSSQSRAGATVAGVPSRLSPGPAREELLVPVESNQEVCSLERRR